MTSDKILITHYNVIFNDIRNSLKYNINNNILYPQFKLLNQQLSYNIINSIKNSIIDTLDTPYYYNLFINQGYDNILEFIKASFISKIDYTKYFKSHIIFKYYSTINTFNRKLFKIIILFFFFILMFNIKK